MKLVVHCASGKINGGGNSKGSCQGNEENRLMSWRGWSRKLRKNSLSARLGL